MAVLWRLPADLLLDGVEAGDTPEDLIGDRRALLRRGLGNLAPGMHPAVSEHQRIAATSLGTGKTMVSGIAIDLQHTIEAVEDGLGVNAAAAGRIIEDDTGWVVAAPWPVV